jgi:hypothetical protein
MSDSPSPFVSIGMMSGGLFWSPMTGVDPSSPVVPPLDPVVPPTWGVILSPMLDTGVSAPMIPSKSPIKRKKRNKYKGTITEDRLFCKNLSKIILKIRNWGYSSEKE